MVTLFRNKSFASIFLLLILAIAVHIHFLYKDVEITVANDGVISYLLINYLKPLPAIFLWMLYILLLLLQSIRLNLFLNENKLFQQGGYTVGMTYILFSGFTPLWSNLNAAFIANSLVILLLVLVGKLYNNHSAKTLIFNIGLISGITILAYHPTVVLFAVLLFALLILRPFRLAELLILLLGIITPFYLLAAVLFLNDKIELFYRFIPAFNLKMLYLHYDVWLIAGMALTVILLISGFLSWVPVNNRMLIHIRKNWSVIFIMLLALLTIPFIFTYTSLESLFLLIVPLSTIVANIFQYPKRLFYPNFLFVLAVIIIIHTNLVLSKF